MLVIRDRRAPKTTIPKINSSIKDIRTAKWGEALTTILKYLTTIIRDNCRMLSIITKITTRTIILDPHKFLVLQEVASINYQSIHLKDSLCNSRIRLHNRSTTLKRLGESVTFRRSSILHRRAKLDKWASMWITFIIRATRDHHTKTNPWSLPTSIISNNINNTWMVPTILTPGRKRCSTSRNNLILSTRQMFRTSRWTIKILIRNKWCPNSTRRRTWDPLQAIRLQIRLIHQTLVKTIRGTTAGDSHPRLERIIRILLR